MISNGLEVNVVELSDTLLAVMSCIMLTKQLGNDGEEPAATENMNVNVPLINPPCESVEVRDPPATVSVTGPVRFTPLVAFEAAGAQLTEIGAKPLGRESVPVQVPLNV